MTAVIFGIVSLAPIESRARLFLGSNIRMGLDPKAADLDGFIHSELERIKDLDKPELLLDGTVRQEQDLGEIRHEPEGEEGDEEQRQRRRGGRQRAHRRPLDSSLFAGRPPGAAAQAGFAGGAAEPGGDRRHERRTGC